VTTDREKFSMSPAGFAGLALLVSDIDALVSAVTRSAPRQTTTGAGTSGSVPAPVHGSAPREDDQSVRDHNPAAAPVQPASTGRWVLGAAGALIVLWLVALIGSTSDSTTTPTVTTSSFSPSRTSNEPLTDQASNEPDFTIPSGGQSSIIQQPNLSDGSEQVPPIGSDHVLGTAQIRYCLAEDIRLEAARDGVRADAEIDRFNSMVEDFNSRCASYRYRRQEFEAVKRQVEADRSLLEVEGLGRLGREQ